MNDQKDVHQSKQLDLFSSNGISPLTYPWNEATTEELQRVIQMCELELATRELTASRQREWDIV